MSQSPPAPSLPIVTLFHEYTTPPADAIQQQTIISALPVTLVGTSAPIGSGTIVTGTQDVIVVAEKVMISGTIVLNGGAASTGDGTGRSSKSLTVICREFSWGNNATIIANGESGSTATSTGTDGQQGADHVSDNGEFQFVHPDSGNTGDVVKGFGEHSTFYSVNLHDSLGSRGTDATGAGGAGGDGGNGGNIIIKADHLGSCDGVLVINTAGGDGGAGAAGPVGGDGGGGGDLFMNNTTIDTWPDGWGPEDPPSSVDWSQIGTSPGVCAGGAGGNGGPGGDSGTPGAGGNIVISVVNTPDFSSNVQVSAGPGAAHAGAGGAGGSRGSPGHLGYLYNDSGSESVPQPPPAGDPSGAGQPGAAGAVPPAFNTYLSESEAANGRFQMAVQDGSNVPDLFYIKTAHTGSNAVEVHSADADQGYSSGEHIATGLPLGPAASAFVLGDCLATGPLGIESFALGLFDASGGPVIFNVSFGPNFSEVDQSNPTRFDSVVAANGTLQLDNADLYLVQARATASGMVEVHSATSDTGYAQGADWVSSLATADAANGTLQICEGNLYFLQTAGTNSGMVELQVRSQSDGYQAVQTSQTWFPVSDAPNGSFQVVGRNLYFLKYRNTFSGQVEVYVAFEDSYNVQPGAVPGAVDLDTTYPLAELSGALCAYPEFVNMLFQRARGAYALGGASASSGGADALDTVADAMDWFGWLRTLGNAVSPAVPNANVIISAGSEAEALIVQSRGTPGSAGYIDYYGNPQSVLPRLAFDQTFLTFNDTLAAYRGIYNALGTYQQAGADASQLDAQLNSSESLDTQIGTDLTNLDTLLAGLRTQITAAQKQSETDQANIVQALQTFEQQIQSAMGCQLALSDMLTAANQLSQLAMDSAASADALMARDDGGDDDGDDGNDALFKGWSQASAGLQTLIKQRQDQDMLIQQLDTYGKDVTDPSLIVQNAQKYGENPDGTLQLPNAYKVVNAAELLEQKVNALQSIDADAVQAMIATINSFIAAVEHLNDVVMQYNSIVGKRLALQTKRVRVEAQISAYGSGLSTIPDPAQLQYIQYLFSLLEQSRDQVLAQLYDGICSYNVWALGAKTLRDYVNAPTVDDLKPEVLQLAQANMAIDVQAAQASHGQPPHPFSPPVTVTLNDAPTINALKAQMRCSFMLSVPAPQDTSSPFGGGFWAEIRITSVQIHVVGLKTSSPNPHYVLNAYGPQSFYDQDGNLFTFGPTDLNETFNVDYFDGVTPSGGTAPQFDPTFPLPSPFTSWELIIGADNMDLDTSGVTAIQLIFEGQHYDFHSTQPGAV